MDVVYIVRPGDRNDELRYSLRSLANLPHDRVWIVGHRPPWVTNVTHVVAEQGGYKHANTWRAWLTIAAHDGISDEFVLFNDDMFVMHPVDRVPLWWREPLDVWVDRWARCGVRGYARAMSTVKLLADAGVDVAGGKAWELHTPMPARKEALVAAVEAALSLGSGIELASMLSKRTWYANHARLVGEQGNDCKIRSDQEWQQAGGAAEVSSWPFLSTDDASFARSQVGEYIRARFPTPCVYEADQREEGQPLRFVSVKYPDLHIPTIGVRFVDGAAEVTTRGAVAYLQTPMMRRRGVMLAEEAPTTVADTTTEPETPSREQPSGEAPAAGVPDGTAADVLAWVDSDPDRAKAAITAEQARSKPRSSLLTKLERIANTTTVIAPTSTVHAPTSEEA